MDSPSSSHAGAGTRPPTSPVPADSRQGRQLERRQAIAEAVMNEGTVRIEELAERFGISLMTAHRDLDELALRGLLRKTRGVASAAPTHLIEASDVYRTSRQAEEKAAIAFAALGHVEPGQAIFLDDSTTVLSMAAQLGTRVPLTVITNSLTLMNELRGVPELTLLGLGGQHHRWCNAFMGPTTVREISRLRADTLILSMAAITDGVVYHQSQETIQTKRAMFDAASRRILLADHTKFERRALHGFLKLSAFDLVIVDGATPAAHIERMRDQGIEVVVTDVGNLNPDPDPDPPGA